MYGYHIAHSNKEINMVLKGELYLGMRYTLPLVLLYVLSTGQHCTKKHNNDDLETKTKYPVAIQATYTSPYCGGARPTEEIMEESRTHKPLAGQAFHVKPGETNSMSIKTCAQADTDTTGNLTIELAPGKYMLLLPEQIVKMDTVAYPDTQYYHYDRKLMNRY